jgi:hypothetical protein
LDDEIAGKCNKPLGLAELLVAGLLGVGSPIAMPFCCRGASSFALMTGIALSLCQPRTTGNRERKLTFVMADPFTSPKLAKSEPKKTEVKEPKEQSKQAA